MSLNPSIRDQAYNFFVEEARELLQVLETGLLEIRQDRSTPKVHELMRAAHSIKGGAASVELGAIELLAHRLEDFFKALYSDEVDIDAELEGLLLQGYDCLSNPLTEQIEAGTFDEEAALLNAEPVFSALELRLEDALKSTDNYIPSSNDLGVDIVASIFEVDVAEALEKLQQVAADSSQHNLAAELESTLDMFAGFAELFNLPGFSDIVLTAQTAIAQNPPRAREIINATVSDCTAAKNSILAGDRDRGGVVSDTLRQLATGENSGTGNSTEEATVVFDELASDGEHLWSNTPEPLAEDIFASLDEPEPESEPEIAELQPNLDFTEDIFASLEEPESKSESQITLDFDELPTDEANLWTSAPEPLAEDIFASLDEPEPESEPEIAASQSTLDFDELPTDEANLWTSAPEPLAEDIFASVDGTQEDLADERFEHRDSELELEEIFGFGDRFVDLETAGIDQTEQTKQTDDSAEPILKSVADTTAEIDNLVESITTSIVDGESRDIPQPDNLTTAVDSIEEIFDRLPKATDELDLAIEQSSSESAESTALQPQATPKPTKQPNATPSLTVRVEMSRLEQMNNLVGELTIERNSLALQNEQLQENVSGLGQKFQRFRRTTKQLREISDRLVLEQRIRDTAEVSTPSEKSITDEFDALEMDRYSQLHTALQQIMEETIQLEESVEDITIFAQQSDRTIDRQRQMLGQMRDELMWVRMLPLEQILQRFPRNLRELSQKHNKPVKLTLSGTQVLVDKAVLEKLSDPLLHLLRNGFDHGIESPSQRREKGKPETGSIEIQAYYQGNQTVIEVKDDGKGLDLDKITRKGIERGLITAEQAARAEPDRLFELIFEPGFSTADRVSELSGRGVGMNIVRSQIEVLKGKISVTSTPDLGSTFTMRLPLTLTIAKLLVCSLGATAFAIPSDSIEEIIIPTHEQIKSSNAQRFLIFGDKLIPVFNLRQILQYNCSVVDTASSSMAFKTIAPPEDWSAPLLLLRRDRQLYALEVVSLLSEQELVIKPYGKAIAAPSYSYGCTILGDGSLIPAFDGAALIAKILGEELQTVSATVSSLSDEDFDDAEKLKGGEAEAARAPATAFQTIMIVDDSTALRRTMALTLENAGYRVVQKKDGKEALNGFKQNPDLDLIICDVEMPVMNGFEFLGMRRRDSALSQVPTFMLTSRSGAKHRNLAKQLGANGYFTKPYVEQEFIGEVNKILHRDRPVRSDNHSAIAIKTKTILVIDDSSALRRTLASSLERKNYRVLQARDGLEGLQQLRENPQTNLVICDVEMPNLNGFEFLTARRNEPALAQIPTIMLTSRSSEKHQTLATQLNARGFFTKPYVEEKFLREIEKYIS